jgi:hypothetical protein
MTSVEVFANVYRLIPAQDQAGQIGNDALEFIKMGVYHTGIEIFGQEYSFGMDPSGSGDPTTDGIFVVRPRRAVGDFKESVKLGEVKMDRAQFDALLNAVRPQWRAVSYHILKHNCCVFSLTLAKALNPAFEGTFPNYVLKSASVGGAIIPDAVVMNLTQALSPPTSAPAHLINKIEVSTTTVPPKAGAPRQAPAAGGGGVFGFAKGLTDKVKAAVGKDEASKCVKAFGDMSAGDIVETFGCHVHHIHREQYADVFVTTKGLCFVGENKLALRLPWAQIASLSYGIRVESGNLGTYTVYDSKPAANACLLVFTADGKMIPLFQFTGFGELITGAIGKLTGSTTNERLEKAFDAIDAQWRKK